MERNRFERTVVGYARWLIRWKWVVLFLATLLTVSMASGLKFLGLATNYRAFFGENSPELIEFEKLQHIYTKDDNVIFVLAPENGDVFTSEVLNAVKYVTQKAWELPYVTRVDSITNFQNTYAVGDELIVEDLVSDSLKLNDEDLNKIKSIALSEPTLVRQLISDGGEVTGIIATMYLPGESDKEVPLVVEEARKLATDIKARFPNVRPYLSGIVMLNNAFNEAGIQDMTTLIPISYAIILLIILLVLRSAKATVGIMFVVMSSSAVAMGLAGWFGIKLTPPTAITPNIIMILAVADSIHLLSSMFHLMDKGYSKDEAIVDCLRTNMAPVFYTSLSTAICFLTLNYADAPPLRHLGIIAAVGVTVAFFYSVTFLPAFLAAVRIAPSKKTGDYGAEFLSKLSHFVVDNRRMLLAGITVMMIAALAFIPRIYFSDRYVDYFDESMAIRQDSDFVMDNLTGLYVVFYSLSSEGPNGINEPEYLSKIDDFSRWYRQQPGVIHVNTFSDTMKRLNENLHGDDPSWYKLPSRKDLAAQYLLLYEMSLPYGLDLNNQINTDKSSTRIAVTLENMGTRKMRTIFEKAKKWLRNNVPEYMYHPGAGSSVMFTLISERNIGGIIFGTTIGIFFISFMLIFMFRSLKLGFLSIIINLIPAATAFGVWGLFMQEINFAVATVAAMTLGIVVDDTIHFLYKYIYARREEKKSPSQAVHYAFKTVGRAIITSSVALTLGFCVLTKSTFQLNSYVGLLTSIIISIALLVDILFLPPLLLFIEEKTNA